MTNSSHSYRPQHAHKVSKSSLSCRDRYVLCPCIAAELSLSLIAFSSPFVRSNSFLNHSISLSCSIQSFFNRLSSSASASVFRSHIFATVRLAYLGTWRRRKMVVLSFMVSCCLSAALAWMKCWLMYLLLDCRTTPAPGIGAERSAGPAFLMVIFARAILFDDVGAGEVGTGKMGVIV